MGWTSSLNQAGAEHSEKGCPEQGQDPGDRTARYHAAQTNQLAPVWDTPLHGLRTGCMRTATVVTAALLPGTVEWPQFSPGQETQTVTELKP